MRKLFAVLVVISFIAFAKPAICALDDYNLAFLSSSDAGVTLQTTPLGRLTAPDAGASCGGTAKTVTATFVDPWTGETVTVSLAETP